MSSDKEKKLKKQIKDTQIALKKAIERGHYKDARECEVMIRNLESELNHE